jgi:MFS family permease
MPRLLDALRHPQYRLYYLAQVISLHGSWMQQVAQSWLIYRLTESSFMLGLAGFLSNLPVLVLGLAGGLLADTLPRRPLFIVLQGLAMAQAFALAILTLGGWVEIWHILLLGTLLGVVHAFDMPARHAFVVELVPREALPNAIGLNSSAFNVARFLGPALAGWLVALAGEGWVFLINGLSFTVLLVGLIVMGRPQFAHRPADMGSPGSLRMAIGYAWHHRPVRTALAMVLLISLTGIGYITLMPIFAKDVFHGGPQSLGLLLGAAGAGALVGALRLAQRGRAAGLEREIVWAGLIAAAGLIVFSHMESVTAGLLILPAVGYGITTLAAGCNTVIQLLVPDRLRGRVMALFAVLFVGHTPLGYLLAGSLAAVVGAPLALLLLAVALGLGMIALRGGFAGTGEVPGV